MDRKVASPASRAEWLAARALLASERLRPFVPFVVGAGALVFAMVYAVRGPLADEAAARQRTSGRALAASRDTLPMIAELRASTAVLEQRDSTLRLLQFRAEAQAAAPVLTAEQARQRDSLRTLITQLDGALDRAAKAPLPASYRLLATTKAMRTVPGVPALVDTLDLLDRARRALDPVAAPQREFAQLSQRANAIGSTLQQLAQTQRRAIVRQVATLESAVRANQPLPAGPDTTAAIAARDSARWRVWYAESLLRDTRQWHARVAASTDSVAQAHAARILGASPGAAALAALVIAAVVSFTLAVLAEVRAPTIAHAREAERLTGVPVLASAKGFIPPREGRDRLQPGTGVDPFRMVYLALTASGTKERVVCVTGDDTPLVVAVAARLAVSAAADERATVLIDLAPGVAGASAYFGWREEPGFTEAIAAVRLWREVARPVGVTEGISLDVIPSGMRRQDTNESVASESSRTEFTRFIEEYDFTVLVAPTATAVRVARDICSSPPTITVARTAKTRLTELAKAMQTLDDDAVTIHGIILIA